MRDAMTIGVLMAEDFVAVDENGTSCDCCTAVARLKYELFFFFLAMDREKLAAPSKRTAYSRMQQVFHGPLIKV